MARTKEQQSKVEESFEASTINEKKSFLFAVAWLLRTKFSFKKFPKAYDLAKANIGVRSLVFGVPAWPKDQDYRKEKQAQQMRMYYQLLEKSLDNDEYRVRASCQALLLWESSYYHKNIGHEVCESAWWDVLTPVRAPWLPYTDDSKHLASKVFDGEDFGLAMDIFRDSLEDSGHAAELDHFQGGVHTPACPVLRAIARIK